MTLFYSNRRTLFFSVVALIICIIMLLGATYAWFTDSATSPDNNIQTGNLDVEMYWANGIEDPNSASWTDASTGAIFKYDKWEPGYAEVRHIKIANEGTLSLKYQVNIVANGEVSDLSDVIDVYYVDPAVQVADSAALASAPKLGTLTEVLANLGETGSGELPAAAEGAESAHTITIALKMQENAGNEYMNKSIGTSFSIQLVATQLADEEDSFGDQYDADATYPILSNAIPVTGNAQAASTLTTKNMNVNVPAELLNSLVGVAEKLDIQHSEPRIEGDTVVFDSIEFYDENGNVIDLEALNNDIPVTVTLYLGDAFTEGTEVKVSHNGEIIAVATVDADGKISYTATHLCEVKISEVPLVSITRGGVEYGFASIQEAMDAAIDGDVIVLKASTNTSDEPLTETITVSKNISLNHNGMYLVSAAPATFTVLEGASLTVLEGSFTIKNTSANGVAVFVDGGSFTMAGGSFDAHTAVKTAEGKSSTVTMTAGWSNRVTVAFHSQGNDTINVTGGSIYSSAESVKTTAGTHLIFNMSGGLLSSKTTQYSAAVNLQCTATVNMTGGKIENTYSSGYNGSSAIEVNVAPTTINLSGTAALSSNGTAVMLGSHWESPAVHEEKIAFNMSGDSSISATSVMGFGIRYAQDNCDVTISGNAKVNATYQAIQFNTNNYVYTNSTLTVSENATITSTAGRIGGGYAIASNGHVTITGGTITGSTAGVASSQEGAVVIVDNSASGTAITINKVDIADGVTYTVAGNPSIGQ